MDETPDPPKSKFARFIRWLCLIIGAVVVFVLGFAIAVSRSLKSPQSLDGTLIFVLVHVVAVACILALLIWIFRWILRHLDWFSRLWAILFTWRNGRRLLAGLVILATLIALAYAVENWRGKRAWEQCKRDLEAKGEVLDWAAYIPAPIPDEQNIIKAPKMAEWFIKPRPGTTYTNPFGAAFGYQPLYNAAKRDNPKSPVLVAHVSVVPVNSRANSDGQTVVQLDAPDAKERLGKIVQDAIGPNAEGVVSQITLVKRQPSRIEPSRLLLESDKPLSLGDLSELFPASLISSKVGHLQVEAEAAPGSFRIVLAAEPVVSAEDYLAMSDAGVPELDLIREALKRPRIRMAGDFQRPFEMPLVNFVAIRNLAQIAAQRARCCLLLGRSEQAFHELSLMFEARRLLASKPTWLVAAMIDVAVTSLYVETIADGFRLRAWRQPELVALQQQLQQINLSATVADTLDDERATVCQAFQVMAADELMGSFSYGGSKSSLWKKMTHPVYVLFKFAPRGWVYQNLVTLARLGLTGIEVFNPTTQRLNPRKSEEASREVESARGHWAPFTILARLAIPNYTRAMQTTARNQTKVNQALIVCGLERFRLAHGDYPETLDVLVPQFIAKLPHDIIGGQPLKYRRTDDGQFILYSVGWNEVDDGGVLPPTSGSSVDIAKSDWVWRYPAK